MKEPDKTKYYEIFVKAITAEKPLPFDCFIYLSQNDHLLKYVASGFPFPTSKLIRLERYSYNKLYIQTQDLKLYWSYINDFFYTDKGKEVLSEIKSKGLHVAGLPSESEIKLSAMGDFDPSVLVQGGQDDSVFGHVQRIIDHNMVNIQNKLLLRSKLQEEEKTIIKDVTEKISSELILVKSNYENSDNLKMLFKKTAFRIRSQILKLQRVTENKSSPEFAHFNDLIDDLQGNLDFFDDPHNPIELKIDIAAFVDNFSNSLVALDTITSSDENSVLKSGSQQIQHEMEAHLSPLLAQKLVQNLVPQSAETLSASSDLNKGDQSISPVEAGGQVNAEIADQAVSEQLNSMLQESVSLKQEKAALQNELIRLTQKSESSSLKEEIKTIFEAFEKYKIAVELHNKEKQYVADKLQTTISQLGKSLKDEINKVGHLTRENNLLNDRIVNAKNAASEGVANTINPDEVKNYLKQIDKLQGLVSVANQKADALEKRIQLFKSQEAEYNKHIATLQQTILKLKKG